MVLTAKEEQRVQSAVEYGERWVMDEAEDKVCANKKVELIDERIERAGLDVVVRERTKTKEKLIAVVVNAEKELTKTGVNKVWQAMKDVMKKNTGKHFY